VRLLKFKINNRTECLLVGILLAEVGRSVERKRHRSASFHVFVRKMSDIKNHTPITRGCQWGILRLYYVEDLDLDVFLFF